jgi:hypothetical protein
MPGFWVTVDGPLFAMQVLDTEMWRFVNEGVGFIRRTQGVDAAEQYRSHVSQPFLEANSAGVGRIGEDIADMAPRLSRFGFVGPEGPVETKAMRETSLEHATGTLISLVQAWLSARQSLALVQSPKSPNEAVILLDQELEGFLRTRLGASRKAPYPELTRLAVRRCLLTEAGKTALDQFHTLRNAVQHGGRLVSLEELLRLLTAVTPVIDGFCESRTEGPRRH